MLKIKRHKIIIILVISSFLAFSFMDKAISQPFPEIHEKLSKITEEEREILEDLFILIQEIEAAEREEDRLESDIDNINKEIKSLELAIDKDGKTYEKNKDALEQVLKSYQRMGPGSYIEIILDSDNLKTFLQRINILQDITRNTGELLKNIEDSRDNLLNMKDKLGNKLALEEDKKRELKDILARKIGRRNEIETYLASLEGQRAYYEDYLADLQKIWNQVGETLIDTIGEISRIISEESLPLDAMKLSFSLLRAKGTIEERVFNDIFNKYPKLPEISFKFLEDKLEIELADSNVILGGKLLIVDGKALEFEIEEGRFYGMPLERHSIDELFKDNKLVLNLEPLLYGNKLTSVKIQKGYLELISVFKF